MATKSVQSPPGFDVPLRRWLELAGVSLPGPLVFPKIVVNSITDDSRRVAADGCFVAVKGDKFDGHHFVKQAIASGAAVLIVEQSIQAETTNALVLQVADTRVALARLAAVFYGLSGQVIRPLRLIGVTGTNGKTTVVWLIRSILKAAGQRAALLGTIEYDLVAEKIPAPLTTPGSIELCKHLATSYDAGARWAVMEISSHALDQHRVDGLSFAAAAFTNLSGDHLDYHKTKENYAKAKRRLFELLPENAPGIVNLDDAKGSWFAEVVRGRCIGFGLDSPKADVRATNVTTDRFGTLFVLRAKSFEMPIRIQLVGRHNISNCLAAAATAEALGIEQDAIQRGLESTTGVPGRLQRAEPDGCPFSVLVDYAHTDDALRNVLETVRPITSGKLICVFGCGGDRDRSKRPRMASVVSRLADVAFVTSDNPRTERPETIIDDILPGFGSRPSCRIEVEVDRRKAIAGAIREASAGDTVLIAGKGHEDYQIVGERKFPFDDVKVARASLESVLGQPVVM